MSYKGQSTNYILACTFINATYLQKGWSQNCIFKVLDVTKTKVDTILTYAKNIMVNSSLQVNPNFQ